MNKPLFTGEVWEIKNNFGGYLVIITDIHKDNADWISFGSTNTTGSTKMCYCRKE